MIMMVALPQRVNHLEIGDNSFIVKSNTESDNCINRTSAEIEITHETYDE